MEIKRVNPISSVNQSHNNQKERRQQRPKQQLMSYKDVFEKTKSKREREEER